VTLLLALGPALLAIGIFAATLVRTRKPLRATTKAEREWVAARAQVWRVGVLAIGVLLVLGAVAGLHLHDFRNDPFIPRELS
jgi:hypothetical protein